MSPSQALRVLAKHNICLESFHGRVRDQFIDESSSATLVELFEALNGTDLVWQAPVTRVLMDSELNRRSYQRDAVAKQFVANHPVRLTPRRR